MLRLLGHFEPFLIAIGIIVVIEFSIVLLLNPSPAEVNNVLRLAFPEQEKFGRAVIYQKVKFFLEKNPEIIQVGDSSGLMGIRGNVVEEYLPNDVMYANLSCCATQGYRGPFALMKFFIRHNPKLKMVVLHQSPAGNYPKKLNNVWEGKTEFFHSVMMFTTSMLDNTR